MCRRRPGATTGRRRTRPASSTPSASALLCLLLALSAFLAAPAQATPSAGTVVGAAAAVGHVTSTAATSGQPAVTAPGPPRVPSSAQVRGEVRAGESVQVGIATRDTAGNLRIRSEVARGPDEALAAVDTAAKAAGTVAVGIGARVHPTAGDPLRFESLDQPWPFNQYTMDLLCIDQLSTTQSRYPCKGGYAWETATGRNQIVAVIDQGVDTTHPDLAGHVLPGARCLNTATTPCTPVTQTAPADRGDHGTHVAGVISAAANNGIGIAGLAPGSMLLPVEVLTPNDGGTTTDVAAGILWAVANGATVINMSLGADSDDPVLAAAVAEANRLGVVEVAAAGNQGDGTDNPSPVTYPAAYPDVIGVGAVDYSRDLAPYSSRGDWVDVVAPGTWVVSTLMDGGYGHMSGTSMASPVVAALAAMLREAHPRDRPADIANRISATATDAGPAGWDSGYGAGIINPVAALAPDPVANANQNVVLPDSFHPIVPARVLDTRTTGPIGGKGALHVSVATDLTGHEVVPADASTIVYNLTIPSPATSGHVRVMPGDVATTTTSAINFAAGQTIANGLDVGLGGSRDIRIFNGANVPVNAIVDVVGYFSATPNPAGGLFTPTIPTRVFDNRQAPASLLPPRSKQLIDVGRPMAGGPDLVPRGATAVAYNITVVEPGASGHLRVMPGDVASTAVSTINWTSGTDKVANGSVVRIASDRTIAVYNGATVPVRFLVDVVGYYSSSGAGYVPMAPARVYDSRARLPLSGPVAPGGERSVSLLTGRSADGTPIANTGVPRGAVAVAYNMTVVPAARSTGGHLRIWPADRGRPNASALNWPAGLSGSRANGAIVGVSSDAQVRIFNGSSDANHVVLDVQGYYVR